jgi:hypothetical protein
MDQVRGKDSVGIISQQYNGVQFEKSVIDPVSFLEHRRVTPLLSGAKALVGHNRAATRGGVSANNAHPFQHGSITLVHNGTLRSNAVTTPYFTVDSESICYALSLADDPITVLESLEGAYALIWFDSRDNSWNIARNDERPLVFMSNTAGDTMWLSSEAGILYACTNEDMKDLDPRTHIFQVPAETYWKIKPDASTPSKLAREVRRFTAKKLQYKPVTYHGGSKKATSTTTGTDNVHSLPDKRVSKNVEQGAYARALEEFQKHVGMPSWYKMEVDQVGHNRGGYCMVSGWLDVEPYAKVVMFNVPFDAVNVGDTLEVFLSSLYLDQYDNRSAIKQQRLENLTFTATEYRVPKAQDPVVCSGCNGVFLVEETQELIDGGHVCLKCLNDPFIHDYFKDDLK